MSLPGRALGAALDRLKGELEEEAHACLLELHAAVVAQLKAGGEEEREAAAARVAEVVGPMKELVLGGGGVIACGEGS